MICERCNAEISEATHCVHELELRLDDGTSVKALAYQGEDGDTCADCGVVAGSYHHRYCDRESCPLCGDQLLKCEAVGCGGSTHLDQVEPLAVRLGVEVTRQ